MGVQHRAADLGTMSGDGATESERGAALRKRMLDMRLDRSKLARALGIDRGTVIRAFKGTASDDTYEMMERWFDRQEAKAGADPAEIVASAGEGGREHVTFRLTGNFGVDVTVEGPIEDMAQLKDAAKELLREMQRDAVQD